MTLDEICENVRTLSAQHDWDQTDVDNRMLHLMSEVGEVATSVIAVERAAGVASPAEVEALRAAAGFEIYDAIWNLCALANTLDVDLTAAARKKASINQNRSWR
jgi:NTP pyrophosphatase (non-canonical NTP hydrolase)